MFLAKAKMFGGNPDTVLNTPVDIVIQAYHFSEFMKIYEDTSIELNKEQKC